VPAEPAGGPRFALGEVVFKEGGELLGFALGAVHLVTEHIGRSDEGAAEVGVGNAQRERGGADAEHRVHIDQNTFVVAAGRNREVALAGERLVVESEFEARFAAKQQLVVADIGRFEVLLAEVECARDELVVEVEDLRIAEVGADITGAEAITVARRTQRAARTAGERGGNAALEALDVGQRGVSEADAGLAGGRVGVDERPLGVEREAADDAGLGLGADEGSAGRCLQLGQRAVPAPLRVELVEPIGDREGRREGIGRNALDFALLKIGAQGAAAEKRTALGIERAQVDRRVEALVLVERGLLPVISRSLSKARRAARRPGTMTLLM